MKKRNTDTTNDLQQEFDCELELRLILNTKRHKNMYYSCNIMIKLKQGQPLKLVKELPYDIIEKLAALSITTCEEFVSLVHDDLYGFAKFLGISNERLLVLYEIVRKRLSPQLAKELEQAPEKFAYGSVFPADEECDSSKEA